MIGTVKQVLPRRTESTASQQHSPLTSVALLATDADGTARFIEVQLAFAGSEHCWFHCTFWRWRFKLLAFLCSGISSYSYSASRYSYSYSIDSSETLEVLWISRVSIDTIRFSSDLPRRFDSTWIASQTESTSWIEAHSSADPRAISKKQFLSFKRCLPLPSAMFSGMIEQLEAIDRVHVGWFQLAI